MAQAKAEDIPAAPAERAAPSGAAAPAQAAADQSKDAAHVRAEPLPEAPAPSEKRGGWWQRARNAISGS